MPNAKFSRESVCFVFRDADSIIVVRAHNLRKMSIDFKTPGRDFIVMLDEIVHENNAFSGQLYGTDFTSSHDIAGPFTVAENLPWAVLDILIGV